MHKISTSWVAFLALQRFQNGIFPISGNFRDEKNINSLIVMFCSSGIFMKRRCPITYERTCSNTNLCYNIIRNILQNHGFLLLFANTELNFHLMYVSYFTTNLNDNY